MRPNLASHVPELEALGIKFDFARFGEETFHELGFSDPSGHTITLLDVVSPVDPSRRISSCPLDIAEHRVRLCPLHRRLDDAAAGVEAMLKATTLADLLAESPPCDGHGGGAGDAGLCPRTKEPCDARDAASRG